MKSYTVESFWSCYKNIDIKKKALVKKAYYIWKNNPFYPSLHFKCINYEENIWSVRVCRGYRALCIFENDIVTWFWIGNHDEYSKYFG
ncbi:MAG TPA: hypothetical protein PK385_11665 [Spirochaetota bacterium]|mgnify:CR=1 FL=1|nr:hypothetical protein [Spirochaetota bacterium]HOS33551.1 hypothetical protein [Spirochaetota bacterium]HOS56699.1 hypothetical protein [Spirochaetota bacterium]HQF78973.1 hypothetical protein [Spirochaetota bacterium]HQH31690.1 hypothetical protein [Spirochaetota bacterium]